jgi:hypothetical protein
MRSARFWIGARAASIFALVSTSLSGLVFRLSIEITVMVFIFLRALSGFVRMMMMMMMMIPGPS